MFVYVYVYVYVYKSFQKKENIFWQIRSCFWRKK